MCCDRIRQKRNTQECLLNVVGSLNVSSIEVLLETFYCPSNSGHVTAHVGAGSTLSKANHLPRIALPDKESAACEENLGIVNEQYAKGL
jgi:hypothetical protein